jgi:methyl-accepting chemotaxis protein
MDAPLGYRRRTLFIKKSFQYRFVTWIVVAVMAVTGVVLLDVFITLHRSEIALNLPISVSDLYNFSSPMTILKLVVFLAGVLAVSVLLSHRIAGPLYRFEKSTEEVARGNLSVRIALRQGDEFQDFQEKFNAMTESLRDKASGDAERAAQIRKDLEVLAKDPVLAPAAAEAVRRAAEALSSIGKSFTL